MTPETAVLWGSALATFVAGVMADDQSERLRNGTFGAIAGAGLGGIAALFNNDKTLLLVGFLGSTIGATIAWVVYLVLATVASRPGGRRLLEYHIRGLKGVSDQIVADEVSRLREALNGWGDGFSRTIERETSELVGTGTEDVNRWIEMAIRNWLCSIVDTYNLVLDAVAQTSTDYRSRASLVVFGVDAQGVELGYHWISYSGRLPAHRRKGFGTESFAYQVLVEAAQSPFFTTAGTANKEGQLRSGSSYYSFVLFRVNQDAVVSVDWPGQLEEGDPYIRIVRDLFHLEVVPSIRQLLDRWTGDACLEVGLHPRKIE